MLLGCIPLVGWILYLFALRAIIGYWPPTDGVGGQLVWGVIFAVTGILGSYPLLWYLGGKRGRRR